MTKCEAVVLMYTKLVLCGTFSKKEVQEHTKVHDLTFLRYIQDLKKYIKKYLPNRELVYSRKDNCYYLIDTRHKRKGYNYSLYRVGLVDVKQVN